MENERIVGSECGKTIYRKELTNIKVILVTEKWDDCLKMVTIKRQTIKPSLNNCNNKNSNWKW